MADAKTKDNGADSLSFSELMPPKAQKAQNPSLKEKAGKTVVIVSVGAEKEGGPFFVTLDDDTKWTVPPTTAKKVTEALRAAKAKNVSKIRANVAALDRGIRLS